MTPLPNNHYALEVPEGADNIELHEEEKQYITYHVGMGTEDYDILRDTLPPGSWEIVSLTSGISEEQAKAICPRIKDWSTDLYHNHTAGGRDFRDVIDSAFDTALASFRSLLTSLGMEKEYLIIVKK
jgi:hypothetical protein